MTFPVCLSLIHILLESGGGKNVVNTTHSNIYRSRDEKKQDDMRHRLQNSKVKFYIGNVRNKTSVDIAMRGVDYVFAAAALKQVPSCEFFPMEATRTNVLGTGNVSISACSSSVRG